uniref:Uncharacterized protein n=1 Tax=Panagrolaimus davidi TaxID=227884 RepID=A0A914QWN0_9BILA
MISFLTLTFASILFVGFVEARYFDKDVASNGYNAKTFDYYDVAKGNIPTYLTEVDKPLEPFQEDSEPIKINGLVDNNVSFGLKHLLIYHEFILKS